MPQKQVLLLFSYETYPSGQQLYKHHADILNQVQGDTADVQFVNGYLHDLQFIYDGVSLTVIEPHVGKDIATFDFVFFQKWMSLPQHALAASHYLASKQRHFMSSEVQHQNPMSKLGELVLYIRAGVSIPKTVVAPLHAMKDLFEAGRVPFGFPCIVKETAGTRGSNNFLIHSLDELSEIEQQAPNLTFMAQEFIPNDCDYRITIMGGEVAYVLKRSRQTDTHLNNTSQGGMGQIVPADSLPEGVIEACRKAAIATGRQDFAGVDIIMQDDKYWVLEVNKTPEIQTGHDFSHKSKLLVDYIKRNIS